MGARALYLGSTVYRIHGTNQPETIGQAISSGCFRLANGDVIDLFERVPVGAKVIIRMGRRSEEAVMSWRTTLAALALVLLGFGQSAQAQGSTLDQVRQRGTLQCGVSTGLYGFSFQQDGKWAGFDVDFCRPWRQRSSAVQTA